MSPTSPGFFIGYETLETWAQAADPALPVYAMLVETTGPTGNYGLAWREVQARVFQVRDGQAHYCLITVAGWQTIHGKALDAEKRQQQDRAARSAWRHIAAWLREQGYHVTQATVAVPKDLRLLNGAAAFLTYDQEQGVYTRDHAD